MPVERHRDVELEFRHASLVAFCHADTNILRVNRSFQAGSVTGATGVFFCDNTVKKSELPKAKVEIAKDGHELECRSCLVSITLVFAPLPASG